MLDYMVQAHTRGGSGSDTPTELFIQIPAIHILMYVLLLAGHPAESCLQRAHSLGGRSSKHDKAPQGADGRTQYNFGSMSNLQAVLRR